MRYTFISFLFLLLSFSVYGQIQKYPVFKTCDTVIIEKLSYCFKKELKEAVISEFKVPDNLEKENFKATVNIVFLVSSEGNFKVIYVNSPYKELKAEAERVFDLLPQITPAKYNNHPIEMQFVLPLKIPLTENSEEIYVEEEKAEAIIADEEVTDIIEKRPDDTLFPEHKSELNIPFVHSEYSKFDYYLNQQDNSHTAVKPYIYSEMSKYVDLDAQKNKLIKPKQTWFGRKLLNEHMVYVKGKDYWFTLNPVVDLQLGRDSKDVNTFNNTRAVQINGGLGKNFNFSASFYESQGRFAKYVNDYANYIKPDGGNPAIVPGRGIAKEIYTDAYDYPVSEAYLSYTPSKFFNFQFGYGKNFIGDGYRSLFLSDVASPHSFFKISTNFWKIKYTNIWMWLEDVRPELTVDGAHKQKFMAIHYLSWNVTKKLNLGFYEAVIWDKANDRGFEVDYANPLLFYNAIEFSRGSRAGNSLLGLNLKYKLKNISLYSQILIDDLRFSEITDSKSWWGNKYGIQLGAKYYNAFNIENLYLQAEFNSVRPYTYSHDELNYNFGHKNQSMAHLWGSNFNEIIGIARYTKERWFANAKLIVGEKGFDYNNGLDTYSYGGNIFRDNDDRASDYDNEIGQGNNAKIFIGDLQVGYLVNPTTNLKLFAGFTYRNFDPNEPTNMFVKSNSTWVTFGLKTDVFNWYFDF